MQLAELQGKVELPASQGVYYENKGMGLGRIISCTLRWEVWEDSDEAGDIDLLNSEVLFASKKGLLTSSGISVSPTVLLAVPPLSEGINPALPEKTVTAFPEAAAKQDIADSP